MFGFRCFVGKSVGYWSLAVLYFVIGLLDFTVPEKIWSQVMDVPGCQTSVCETQSWPTTAEAYGAALVFEEGSSQNPPGDTTWRFQSRMC